MQKSGSVRIILWAVLITAFLCGNAFAYGNGVAGRTLKPGSSPGCTCHSGSANTYFNIENNFGKFIPRSIPLLNTMELILFFNAGRSVISDDAQSLLLNDFVYYRSLSSI